MRSALRKTITPLLLTIGLGLSACATQGEIRAELESEEGRALIKEVLQEEMKTMMESEEHRAEMMGMMMRMMEEMRGGPGS